MRMALKDYGRAISAYDDVMLGSHEAMVYETRHDGELIDAHSFTADKGTRMLRWTVTYSGLTGPVTAGHFHGPAAPGTNAGVVIPFTGNLASPIEGSATLTEAQMADLVAGRWYANLHTAAHPGGEIRGQVTGH